MKPEELREIRERAAKATRPPWRVDDGRIIQTNHITRDVWWIPRTEEDLEFIAASREDIPKLLDALAQWQELAAELWKSIRHASSCPSSKRVASRCSCGAQSAIDKLAEMKGEGDGSDV